MHPRTRVARSPKGMIITKVNGKDVTSADVTHADIVAMLAAVQDSVTLTVGDLMDVPGALTVTIPRHPDGLGLSMTSDGDSNGVQISSIKPNGNASRTMAEVGMRIAQVRTPI
jgi:hypothetical protein